MRLPAQPVLASPAPAALPAQPVPPQPAPAPAGQAGAEPEAVAPEAAGPSEQVELSKASQAANSESPLDSPRELSFPDRGPDAPASPEVMVDQVAEGNPDDLKSRIVAAKLRLAELREQPGEAAAAERAQIQQDVLAAIAELRAEGGFAPKSEGRSSQAWTEEDSFALLPEIGDTAQRLQERFGGQITFFALEEMMNNLAGSEAKQHGSAAARDTVLTALAEIEAAAGSRQSLEPVIRQLAERSSYEFHPSLRGEDRYNPFVDARREAAGIRAADRRETDPDADRFRTEHSPALEAITRGLDESRFGSSLMTMDSLSMIFTRLSKRYGAETAREYLQDLSEVAAQRDPGALRETVRLLAADTGYEFNPGLQDERRHDPFLANRERAYRSEGAQTSLAESRNTHFGLSLSLSRGISFHAGRNREAVRAPQWLMHLIITHAEDPQRLRQLLERYSPLLSEINRRPISFDFGEQPDQAVAATP